MRVRTDGYTDTLTDAPVFSDVRYMSSSVRLSSVCCLSICRLSVTFVRPTQAIEIFGNVPTPFGTLAIHDLSVKILRRSSQGNPSGVEVVYELSIGTKIGDLE